MEKTGYELTYSNDKSELLSVEFDESFNHGQKLYIQPGTKIIKTDAIKVLNDLETIILPDSLVIIEDNAICACASLRSIFIPKNVRSIGERFLSECNNLEKINVDSENPYFTVKNGILWSNNFTEIIKLPSKFGIEKLAIPDTVKSIREWALSHNEFLKEVSLPKNIKQIPESFCAGCSNIEQVILPEDLEVINDYAFWACEGLLTVNFPVKLQEIGVGAFSGCNFSQIHLPDSLKSINRNAFWGCNRLKSLHIPRGVEYFDASAFVEAPLENISVDSHNKSFSINNGVLFSHDGKTLLLYPSNASELHYSVPEGTEVIGFFCFSCCENLVSIHIPTSLRQINIPGFIFKCYKLEKFFVNKTNLFFIQLDNILFSKNMQTLIWYPEGKKPLNGVVHIPDGVKNGILLLFLQNNQHIKEVTCPKSLRRLINNTIDYKFKVTYREITCSYDIHKISNDKLHEKAKNDALELTCVIFPDRGIVPIHTEVSEESVLIWIEDIGPIYYIPIDLIRDFVDDMIECGDILDLKNFIDYI